MVLSTLHRRNECSVLLLSTIHSSVPRSREFRNSNAVLEGKARFLRENGKGKRPNKAKSLTTAEEEVLWESGKLGGHTPRALIKTVWWQLTQHFGLRGRQEHSMKVEASLFMLLQLLTLHNINHNFAKNQV